MTYFSQPTFVLKQGKLPHPNENIDMIIMPFSLFYDACSIDCMHFTIFFGYVVGSSINIVFSHGLLILNIQCTGALALGGH